MPNDWKLLYDGLELSFAQWNEKLGFPIAEPVREVSPNGTDLLSFKTPGEHPAQDAAFAFENDVTVKRNGSPWFVGTCFINPRVGQPQMQEASYQFEGPLYWLKKFIFCQKFWQSETFLSDLNLFQTLQGAYQNVGQQITEILQYAADCTALKFGTAKFQVGTINIPTQPLMHFVQGITCAEALDICRRWAPNTTVWADFSTSPPTVNVKLTSQMSAQSLAYNGAGKQGVRIVRRDDLKINAVYITYQVTAVVDGHPYTQAIVDKFPATCTGREANCYRPTYNLQGATFVTTKIETETVNAGHANAAVRKAWWLKKKPLLEKYYDEGEFEEDLSIEFLSCKDELGNAVSLVDYPNEIGPNSQWAEWLPGTKKRVHLVARVTGHLRGNDGETKEREQVEEIDYECDVTGLASNTYTNRTSPGDAQPVGLAEYLYNSLSIAHYEGDHSYIGDIGAGDDVSKLLNLTGDNDAWTNMGAMVQSVVYDLFGETTALRFGPPIILTGSELIELMAVSRNLNRSVNFSARTSNAVQNNGVNLGQSTGSRSRDSIPTTLKMLRVWDGEDAEKGIVLDSLKCEYPTGSGTFYLLEITAVPMRRKNPANNQCQNGHRLLLCSEFIPAAT